MRHRTKKRVLVSLAGIFLFAALANAADNAPRPSDWTVVKKWLALHNSLRTLAADFTQTRAMHTLRSPLVSRGHFWFAAPDSFRWEIGTPPKIVVLRKNKAIYLIHPNKNEAERLPETDMDSEAQFGMVNSLSAKSLEAFQRQFEVTSLETKDGVCHVTMLPRDPQIRNALTAIKLQIDEKSHVLTGIEVVTREGSSIRTEFNNVQINPRLDSSTFNYDLSGLTIIDAKE